MQANNKTSGAGIVREFAWISEQPLRPGWWMTGFISLRETDEEASSLGPGYERTPGITRALLATPVSRSCRPFIGK